MTNIAPIGGTDLFSRSVKQQDVKPAIVQEQNHFSTTTSELASQDSLSSLRHRFGQLSVLLERRMTALEKLFREALRSLTRSCEQEQEHPFAQSHALRPNSGVPENPYGGLIRRIAQRHEIDPALVAAVVRQESGYKADAVSNAGAVGLMQLMPDTARSLGVDDPRDPRQNVEGGTRLLRGLIDRYSGRLDLALAAYNAGTAAVDRYHGIPPYAETRAYVNGILTTYRQSALIS